MNKLGNLVLLNRKQNSKLSNDSFEVKRMTLLNSAYPLTREVGKETSWTPALVEAQHSRLLKLAAVVWRLPYLPAS